MPWSTGALFLPPLLEGFPWAGQVYMWHNSTYGRGGVVVELWYDPQPPFLEDIHAYYQQAAAKHDEVWKWLEARFQLWAIPELIVQGVALQEPTDDGAGKQGWQRVQIRGRFDICPRVARPGR